MRCGNIPDRRRKQDEEDLANNRSRKRGLGRTLLDPAISKIWRAQKLLRRSRPTKQGKNAGNELLSPIEARDCKLRGIFPNQIKARTWCQSRVIGDAQLNHPVELYPSTRFPCAA